MLKDKVIVITGGAGLLGKEFVHSIVANYGIAVIADTDIKSAREVQSSILQNYDQAKIEIEEMDITNSSSIESLILKLNSKYGHIDALVNNAYPRNKNYGKSFFNVTYIDFCENINLHLGGYFLTSQIFSRFFVEQGFGNIINISSIYGVIPPRFEVYENTEMTMPVEYALIKSALIQLTKYMTKYLKNKNIRINSMSLGGIKDKQPTSFLEKYKEFCINKGMLDPEDITGTLVFLLSDQSKYINGHNIIIDDGFTL